MLIYIVVGAAGLLVLLVTLVMGDLLGGDHDMAHGGGDHSGPGVLSVPVMAAFVTAFGVGGVVGRYYELSHPVSSGIGVAAGLILGSIVYQFGRVLHSQQASTDLTMRKLVGEQAVVSVAISAGGVGQVSMSVGGELTEHLARSASGSGIARGVPVTVTALGGDAVLVEPLVRASSTSSGA